ncbi:extensin [Streptomyces sp. cg40]|uniref:extensin n=1 Tax=Streptomyces sp. cg40 TaxID=3419764 RepID=UPI003D09272E
MSSSTPTPVQRHRRATPDSPATPVIPVVPVVPLRPATPVPHTALPASTPLSTSPTHRSATPTHRPAAPGHRTPTPAAPPHPLPVQRSFSSAVSSTLNRVLPATRKAPGARTTGTGITAGIGATLAPSIAPAVPAATPPPAAPPPPYSSTTATTSTTPASPPPAYEAIPAGQFDPRELTDFQLDELVHRIIGRITRLIRTELRLDRERIGKLRDPRH